MQWSACCNVHDGTHKHRCIHHTWTATEPARCTSTMVSSEVAPVFQQHMLIVALLEWLWRRCRHHTQSCASTLHLPSHAAMSNCCRVNSMQQYATVARRVGAAGLCGVHGPSKLSMSRGSRRSSSLLVRTPLHKPSWDGNLYMCFFVDDTIYVTRSVHAACCMRRRN